MCDMKVRNRLATKSSGGLVRVSFLYYEDCSSHELALERLREVMAEESILGELEIVKVETEEHARQLRFVGSPIRPSLGGPPCRYTGRLRRSRRTTRRHQRQQRREVSRR
jgi:hypothetical protein